MNLQAYGNYSAVNSVDYTITNTSRNFKRRNRHVDWSGDGCRGPKRSLTCLANFNMTSSLIRDGRRSRQENPCRVDGI